MAKLKFKKRSEKEFADAFEAQLRRIFKGYQVMQGSSLLYKLVVAPGLKLKPQNFDTPTRGQYAFQTDILIRRKDGTPLVVIELKSGGFSTHDVITYSAKALKHKEIYPYLRYGFVVEGQKTLDRKFFTHNTGFDFALTVGSNTAQEKKALARLLKRQIRIGERLSHLVEGDGNLPTSYEGNIILR